MIACIGWDVVATASTDRVGASCRVATTEPRAVFNPRAHLEGGHRGQQFGRGKGVSFWWHLSMGPISRLPNDMKGFSHTTARYHECLSVCVCVCLSVIMICYQIYDS